MTCLQNGNHYTLCPKKIKLYTKLMVIILLIPNKVSKFFHCCRKVNFLHTLLPTIPSVCCRTILLKLEVRFWHIWKKCKQKCNMHQFLNIHPILMHLAYLLTFSISGSWSIFFVNSRLFYLNKCCELKQCFLHVWHGIDQTIIDNATDEWRGCLRTRVRAKGGHFY